jgi:hypothetical protein
MNSECVVVIPPADIKRNFWQWSLRTYRSGRNIARALFALLRQMPNALSLAPEAAIAAPCSELDRKDYQRIKSSGAKMYARDI